MIDEGVIKWIVNFLKARKYRVRVNVSYSGWHNVTRGIPQGSVSGPILFLMYINDLVDSCGSYCNMYIVADDAKFYRHIEHAEDQEFLQLAINALHQWSEKWLLSLNSSKCHVVSYGRTIDTSTVYTIMDKNQQTVSLAKIDKIKDIGVYFDAKLDFKDHMHKKINKAYMIFGLINRNFKHMSIPTFVALYKSMVRQKKHKYDLTYELCAEMSSAAYCKVVFVIFLS